MSKRSQLSEKSVKKQIHFRIDAHRFRRWNEYAKQRGFQFLSSFIIFCVENTILPIQPGGGSELDEIMQNLRAEQINLKTQLENQINRLTELCRTHAEGKDPDLRDSIVNYLRKIGSANEYVISSDLDVDIEGTYQELCNMLKDGIVDQEIIKGGIKWTLKKQI